jgi:hypothetical protein
LTDVSYHDGAKYLPAESEVSSLRPQN